MPDTRPRIVLTDHPWPHVEVERSILEAAGFALIAGPTETGTAADVERMVQEHDPIAILTCWAQVSAAAIARPSRLGVVARMGVGLDNIAIEAATKRGAWVTNVPDYCTEEVSDHVVALLLNAWRGISHFNGEVHAGRWQPATARSRRVGECTVGIIGHGRIGQRTAQKLARGFGCRVLVTSPSLLRSPGIGAAIGEGIEVADLARMQREADAIVLHVPLTPATRRLVDAPFLAACRRRPLIINVSRGGLIDADALVAAVASGQIAGAGLDVVENEPTPSPGLLSRPEIVLTPHIAFTSERALESLCRTAAEDVVRVLAGERPRHACNEPVR